MEQEYSDAVFDEQRGLSNVVTGSPRGLLFEIKPRFNNEQVTVCNSGPYYWAAPAVCSIALVVTGSYLWLTSRPNAEKGDGLTLLVLGLLIGLWAVHWMFKFSTATVYLVDRSSDWVHRRGLFKKTKRYRVNEPAKLILCNLMYEDGVKRGVFGLALVADSHVLVLCGARTRERVEEYANCLPTQLRYEDGSAVSILLRRVPLGRIYNGPD